MIDLKRLKEIFNDSESKNDSTIHDLVREQFKHDNDFQELHLDNISDTASEDTQTVVSESSPVHKTFVAAEKKLADLLGKKEALVDLIGKKEDKATTELNTIEELEDDTSISWTDAVDHK